MRRLPRHVSENLAGRLLAIALLVTGAAACGGGNGGGGGGGGNPAGPSGGSGSSSSGCFAVVGNKGTITANITGLAPFSGIVGTGASHLVTGGPTPVFTVGAINIQDGTGVVISGLGVVGTSTVGAAAIGTPAQSNSIAVQTRSCSAGTGSWVATIAFGSGTITVTAASATGVSGTFSATLEPGPGSSGTKTITGSFNATF